MFLSPLKAVWLAFIEVEAHRKLTWPSDAPPTVRRLLAERRFEEESTKLAAEIRDSTWVK